MAWQDVAAAGDIPDDRGWPVIVDGEPVAIFRSTGGLTALANRCAHVGSPIDDGWVDDGCVTCPWHGWRYDLASGDLLSAFGARPGLRRYPVRERDGRVEVQAGPVI